MKLLVSHRDFLKSKIRETVSCDLSKARLEAAQCEAIEEVEKWLGTFSEADMAAFKKLGAIRPVRRITIKCGSSYRCVTVDYKASLPLTLQDEEHTKVLFNSPLADKIRLATANYHENSGTLQKSYNAIVDACATWEDLIKLWPEAEKFKPSTHTALVVADPQVVAAIQADSKRRTW